MGRGFADFPEPGYSGGFGKEGGIANGKMKGRMTCQTRNMIGNQGPKKGGGCRTSR